MKRLSTALLLTFIAILAFHCQRDVHPPVGGGNPDPGINAAPISANLQGTVLNELGQPAIGVIVKAGTKTATTDARGYFRINNASLDKNASVITAEKSGYFMAYRTFAATSGTNQATIKLIKKTAIGTINASTGGNVTLSNGAKVALPASGVVKAAGGASYSGDIIVYASYIDPTASDIAQIIPGSFIANDKNNKRVTLSSYGMLAVELQSSTGEKLQIATGKTATLTAPIPTALQASAPSTISLWYVDEQTGIWKEEGTATKSGTNYVGEVKHFSYWNCDVPLPSTTFSATFKNAAGDPIVYAFVRLKPANTAIYGQAYGYTDSSGHVCGNVPANTDLIMEVLNECGNVIYSQHVGPFSGPTDIGTVTINPIGTSLVTVKGKLVDCSNAVVANGSAIIYYNNYVRYASTNSAGEFSITFTVCNATNPTCSVIGVDATTHQQSPTLNIPVTSAVTDAGTIAACGTSTTEFLDFTLDGVAHNMLGSVVDSLVGYTETLAAGGPYLHRTIINGMQFINQTPTFISLYFGNDEVPGTYPVEQLDVMNYQNPTLTAPFNVILTSYASSVGQFYEGSFSGQFTDGSSTVHSISCSFRVKRIQ